MATSCNIVARYQENIKEVDGQGDHVVNRHVGRASLAFGTYSRSRTTQGRQGNNQPRSQGLSASFVVCLSPQRQRRQRRETLETRLGNRLQSSRCSCTLDYPGRNCLQHSVELTVKYAYCFMPCFSDNSPGSNLPKRHSILFLN